MGLQPRMGSRFAVNVGLPGLREREGGLPHDDFAGAMNRLRRRAAAAFMRTKPSGRMDARSLRRTLPVIRFHRRIRQRSTPWLGERECLGLRGAQLNEGAEVRCSAGLLLTELARHGGGGCGGCGGGGGWAQWVWEV